MNRPTKLAVISLGALAFLATIGTGILAANHLTHGYAAYAKARNDKREEEAQAQVRKQLDQEQAIRDQQLAYLKEHEQEIVAYVKAQSPKVESVQIDWTDVRWSESGLFESEESIGIYGRVNNIEDSGWGVGIPAEEDGTLDLDEMYMLRHVNIGGKSIG